MSKKITGSTETVWLVLEGSESPSKLYLRSGSHVHEYDSSRKSSALAYARELVDFGLLNIRVVRASQVRTYGSMAVRDFSKITHTEIIFNN